MKIYMSMISSLFHDDIRNEIETSSDEHGEFFLTDEKFDRIKVGSKIIIEDMFDNNNKYFLLSQISHQTYALISLNNGNRLREGINLGKCKSVNGQIVLSRNEIKRLTGGREFEILKEE